MRIYETCMIFMTSDGIVLVITMGLGWSVYEQQDNPVSSNTPSLLNVFGFITL
ncbi:hypothetical protein Hanom_Chr03g00232141 [Helianthus anomalus]